MASPRPVRRLGFFLISDRDTCPKMTATTAAGGKMPKRLQTRLKIALPLVSGGRPNATAGSSGAVVVADTLFPQTAQKVSPSDRLFPQPGHTELKRSSFPRSDGAGFSIAASCRPAGIHALSRRRLP